MSHKDLSGTFHVLFSGLYTSICPSFFDHFTSISSRIFFSWEKSPDLKLLMFLSYFGIVWAVLGISLYCVSISFNARLFNLDLELAVLLMGCILIGHGQCMIPDESLIVPQYHELCFVGWG
jgi:hypothetical protein